MWFRSSNTISLTTVTIDINGQEFVCMLFENVEEVHVCSQILTETPPNMSGGGQGAILGVRMSKWLEPKMGPGGHNLSLPMTGALTGPLDF